MIGLVPQVHSTTSSGTNSSPGERMLPLHWDLTPSTPTTSHKSLPIWILLWWETLKPLQERSSLVTKLPIFGRIRGPNPSGTHHDRQLLLVTYHPQLKSPPPSMVAPAIAASLISRATVSTTTSKSSSWGTSFYLPRLVPADAVAQWCVFTRAPLININKFSFFICEVSWELEMAAF